MDLCDGGDLGLGDRATRAPAAVSDRRDSTGAWHAVSGRQRDRQRVLATAATATATSTTPAHGNLFDGRDWTGDAARGDWATRPRQRHARGDLGDGRGSMDRIRSSLQHWNSTIRGDHGQPSGKTARHDLQGLVNKDINRVWNHGSKFEGGFHCQYCNLRKRGGGATRFKEHLGHVVGEVRECPNVPRNVKDLMKNAVYETRNKKRKKATDKLRLEREIMDGLYHREGVINIDDDDDAELQMAIRESLSDKNVSRAVERRRGSGSGVRLCWEK
ncbi:hypothetical protein ZWY2020_057956 [Hordeum vulgare]|nr:hypothetical protein ZWY2020_057956 [Hordeum vulgare]